MTDLETRAHDFAKKKHGDTLDDSGKIYFEAHVCQVVKLVKDVTNDESLIAAAYLHDTLEDTETTYAELEKEFGPKIAGLVHELTHEGTREKGYYFPRLKSEGAILIKFADRLSNLSRMDAWTPERRAAYFRKSRFWRDRQGV